MNRKLSVCLALFATVALADGGLHSSGQEQRQRAWDDMPRSRQTAREWGYFEPPTARPDRPINRRRPAPPDPSDNPERRPRREERPLRDPGRDSGAADVRQSPATPYPRFLALINQLRRKRGLRPVRMNRRLITAARDNNKEQYGRGMGHHIVPRGNAQNCAKGNEVSAFHQWVASPPHLANMLNPRATEIGLSGRPDGFWTLNLKIF